MLLSPGSVAEEPARVEAGVPAGLFYASDEQPGITRERQGDAFVYRDPQGRLIRKAAELARIRKLAIPPAYESAWICPSPNGHLQATGRDARGRKQYRYHERWRRERDTGKFDRMAAFHPSVLALGVTLAARQGDADFDTQVPAGRRAAGLSASERRLLAFLARA